MSTFVFFVNKAQIIGMPYILAPLELCGLAPIWRIVYTCMYPAFQLPSSLLWRKISLTIWY